MLNNVNDLITEVLVRNNRTTTEGFITDAMLQDWTRQAHKWAAAYKKWPFTEGRISTTYSGSEEIQFEGFKTDSFRILTIADKRFQKLNFEDYLIAKEEAPSLSGRDARLFSDFGGLLYVHTGNGLSGTLTAYGQYEANLDSTDYTATTVFSGHEEEGNEAIVEKMSGYLKRREHLPQEAELHDQRASTKLDEIWKRIQDEQYAYQTHRSRGGMFKRMDILDGTVDDELLKRDQWY